MTATAAVRKRGNAPAKMANKTMTEAEVIDLLKTEQGTQSLRDFAKMLGVTAAYVSDIYRGRRSPGPSVLEFFGIDKERRVTVEYIFFKR